TDAAGNVQDSTYVITLENTTGDKGEFSVDTSTQKLGGGSADTLDSNQQYRAQIRAEKDGKIAAASQSPIKVGQTNSGTLKFSGINNTLDGTNDPATGKPPVNGPPAPTSTQTNTKTTTATGAPSATTATAPAASGGSLNLSAITSQPANRVQTLADRLDPSTPEGAQIATIWRQLLNLTNIVVILFFLAVGFATIFNVQIDTYGIKKTLPTLIIALILANFSLFITRMVVDVANIIMVSIVNSQGGSRQLVENVASSFIIGGLTQLKNLTTSLGNTATSIPLIGAGSAIGAVIFFGALFAYAGGYLILGAVVIAALAIIVPSIFILILAVLFYLRTYIILALAAVSPLAFIAFALPISQPLFRQWWTQLARWAFMGPIAFFLIWLGVTFGNAFGGAGFEFGTYLIVLAMLYLAISLPFKMGGVITANVGKYLSKPLKAAGGFGAKWYGRTSEVMSGGISNMRGVKFFTRGLTAPGVVRGWGKEADYFYQLESGKQTESGRVTRDIVTSFGKSMLRLSPKQAVRAAREASARGAGRIQGAATQQVKDMIQGFTQQFGSAQEARSAFQRSHAAGRHTEAVAAMAASIMMGGQGAYTSKEAQTMAQQREYAYLASPEGQAALNIARQETLSNPALTPFVNPVKSNGTIKSNIEMKQEQSDAINRKLDLTPANQQEGVINRMVSEEAQANGGQMRYDSPVMRALVNRLRQGTPVPQSTINNVRNTFNIDLESQASIVNRMQTAAPELGQFFSGRLSNNDIAGVAATFQARGLDQILNTIRTQIQGEIARAIPDGRQGEFGAFNLARYRALASSLSQPNADRMNRLLDEFDRAQNNPDYQNDAQQLFNYYNRYIQQAQRNVRNARG
ncbi:oligosaccharide repeat unit polymerase, partial [Candidatus Berkelbacteria bacterium]|nr:oligosaccharide repeat unit polymerase [Candidatus Berkelbacteria bacterium]